MGEGRPLSSGSANAGEFPGTLQHPDDAHLFCVCRCMFVHVYRGQCIPEHAYEGQRSTSDIFLNCSPFFFFFIFETVFHQT